MTKNRRLQTLSRHYVSPCTLCFPLPDRPKTRHNAVRFNGGGFLFRFPRRHTTLLFYATRPTAGFQYFKYARANTEHGAQSVPAINIFGFWTGPIDCAVTIRITTILRNKYCIYFLYDGTREIIRNWRYINSRATRIIYSIALRIRWRNVHERCRFRPRQR